MDKDVVVNSSSIQLYSYDSETKTLSVTFKSNGAEWNYSNVPQSIVDAVFNSQGSIGGKFHNLIKRQYKAVQVG